MLKTGAMNEIKDKEIIDPMQFERGQQGKLHEMEKRRMQGPFLGPPCELVSRIIPDAERLHFHQLVKDVCHREHNVIVIGNAIFKFVDIFTNFGVAPDEFYECLMLGDGHPSAAKESLISIEVKMCFLVRGRKAWDMKEHAHMAVSSLSSLVRQSTMSPQSSRGSTVCCVLGIILIRERAVTGGDYIPP